MSTGLFSVLAHPDLFAFWYVERDEFFYEQIDKLIDAAIKYDVVLELNISKIEINRRHNVEFPKEMAPFPIDLFWKRVAKKKANVIIGLDCHDLCDYTPLKPGAIISNEPGLYILEEGIGIRIEDDVYITENGAEWLSKEIIKDPEEIENYMKGE